MGFTPFEELGNSPILTFSNGSQRAVRMAKVPWDRIEDLVDFLLPAGGFAPPASFPGFPTLIVRSVHFEPFQGETEPTTNSPSDLEYDTVNTSADAKVTIEYERDQFGDDPEEPQIVLQHQWSIGGEFLLLDGAGLEWSDEGFVKDDVKAGLLIPTIEHRITWPQVVFPPFNAMRSCLGTVNGGLMSFATGVIQYETLLFLGAELIRDLTTDGFLAWQVSYRFSERVVPLSEADTLGGEEFGAPLTVGGWNHFFRSEDADNDARVEGKTGFYRLRKKVDGSPIFALANQALLFQGA